MFIVSLHGKVALTYLWLWVDEANKLGHNPRLHVLQKFKNYAATQYNMIVLALA